MTAPSNPHLAQLLDRFGGQEPDPMDLFVALFDGGLFVPLSAPGVVITGRDPEGGRVVLGFADPLPGRDVPGAVGVAHHDAAQLTALLEGTGAVWLVLRSRQGEWKLPRALLDAWARDFPGERLLLEPPTGPDARALREALARRMGGFPAVRTAWLSRARWPDSPDPQLLLHVAVDEDPPGPVANHLLQALLREEPLRHLAYPRVAVVPLHPVAHADTIADLERRNLPPVRHAPRPAPAEPAPEPTAPQPKRRWFRRSRPAADHLHREPS
ncbi:hypothetical protein HUT16_04435 [Kitasatospora sp. NA04385]|uniref:hypothetical protein n=1 Tax=Kitasatospora sp. NA04385 TaxID=2742135 RepID=UPI0015907F91|nr:hypothetical protein [Kitasatospora sp. NA04385]QKW18416.1 hypothetical protein HUT16_04435 [Kitasatospora sp. NA04385]